MIHNFKLIFFGSSEFSVFVLNELKSLGILPLLIVTTPDKPKGRKLVLTPTETKIWAKQNNIECIEPTSLKNNPTLVSELSSFEPEIFLVASYGKIIPKEVFEIPKYKTLNIHPSMLPKYRGASPIQSQILNNEKEIGVTIMQIDEEMDHGPIVTQRLLENSDVAAQSASQGISSAIATKSHLEQKTKPESEDFWERSFSGLLSRKELEKHLAIEGAKLFAEILPNWIEGKIEAKPQEESGATYCTKIEKSDGEIKIDLENMPEGDSALNYLLKIKAFEGWPNTYFFVNTQKNKEDIAIKEDRKMRVIVTDAKIENNKLKLLKVIPEGKKEMSFEDFLRGLRK